MNKSLETLRENFVQWIVDRFYTLTIDSIKNEVLQYPDYVENNVYRNNRRDWYRKLSDEDKEYILSIVKETSEATLYSFLVEVEQFDFEGYNDMEFEIRVKQGKEYILINNTHDFEELYNIFYRLIRK
jgi:hypothetical protein